MADKNDELLTAGDDSHLKQNERTARWLGSLGLAAIVLAVGVTYCLASQAWPMGKDSGFIVQLTNRYGIIAHPAMHAVVASLCCFLPRVLATFKEGRTQGLIATSLWILAFFAATSFVWIGVAFQNG
ncbi:hypothetical protein MalM25_25830 [Planctomycetes bacterium MalM25]|nr:hypothetical protein MalM25_25830 [Planctomycetes bacterium MalM25]